MISFSPSIMYAAIMLLPAGVSVLLIDNEINVNYFYLAVVISLVLLLIDYISCNISGDQNLDLNCLLDNRLLFVISIMFLVVSLVVNIYIHGKIPLLDLVISKDYVNTRAFHSKSSDLFFYASYAINYCNFIFIPYVFFYALNTQRYKTIVVLLPLFVLSYMFFLAKFPLYFFLLVVVGVYFSSRYKVRMFRYVLVAVLLLSCTSLMDILEVSGQGATKKIYNYAVADLYRPIEQGGLHNEINSKLYRIFWVPSDVSAVWLDFYNSNPGGANAGYSENYPNIIGKLYYVSRFPEKYTNDISAYASFEVDALVRYGYSGLIIVLVLWAAARFMMAYWVRVYGNNLINSYFLVSAAVMLPISSLQAFMLSNGFIFIILAPFLISLLNKNTGRDNLTFSKSL